MRTLETAYYGASTHHVSHKITCYQLFLAQLYLMCVSRIKWNTR